MHYMYRILQLGGLVAYSPGDFWKIAITRLNLEAIFNQMWVQLEVILIKKQCFLLMGFKKLYNSGLSKRIESV